tara:strand:+ start:172 stop:1401 length:1230 start_codon:yes stop_codon:yes gene_type:complete
LKNFGKIQALIPRTLCHIENPIELDVNYEGFSPVEISWQNGLVSDIKSINSETSPSQIIFPRFVESHSHIDKSFSWKNFPNKASNYYGALKSNLEEHKTRSVDNVKLRAEESIKLAIKNGYRAVRTHIDTYDSQDERIWAELFNLQKKYSTLLKIQFVALAPLEFWGTDKGEILAKKFRLNNGVIGSVVVPPFNANKLLQSLTKILALASRYNLEIDLHIDESISTKDVGLRVLLKTINKFDYKVPITCSHLSNILLLRERELDKLCISLAEKNIKVVALPLTNFWLLNRSDKTNKMRPVAPIKQLQKSFVDVSIGSDNVQDPWYPFGEFDPFYLMSYSMHLLQLNPWDRLTLSAIISAPSRLLNLEWDGTISVGCPADFVVAKGDSWADLFSNNLQRSVLINGKWYVE